MSISDNKRLREIGQIQTYQELMDDDPIDVVFTLRAEVERLRAELADTKDDYLRRHKDAVDRFEEIIELRANLAEYRAALEAMVERFGICLTMIYGSGMQKVTAEMQMARCNRCPPCIARQTLKELKP